MDPRSAIPLTRLRTVRLGCPLACVLGLLVSRYSVTHLSLKSECGAYLVDVGCDNDSHTFSSLYGTVFWSDGKATDWLIFWPPQVAREDFAPAMLVPTQDSDVLVVEDPLGIVYLIENSQQFWSGMLSLSATSNRVLIILLQSLKMLFIFLAIRPRHCLYSIPH